MKLITINLMQSNDCIYRLPLAWSQKNDVNYIMLIQVLDVEVQILNFEIQIFLSKF